MTEGLLAVVAVALMVGVGWAVLVLEDAALRAFREAWDDERLERWASRGIDIGPCPAALSDLEQWRKDGTQ